MRKISQTLCFLIVAIAAAITTPSGRIFGQTPATPTGLLRVKEPISNQYIVVLKEQEKGVGSPGTELEFAL